VRETTDRGLHWHALAGTGAQDGATRGSGSDDVSRVRFANAHDGWLFDPGLFSTHDGGRTWKGVHLPGGAATQRVAALAAAHGTVYAIASLSSGAEAEKTSLFRSSPGSDEWSRIPEVSHADGDAELGIVLHGTAAWVSAGQSFYASTDGRRWQPRAFPCEEAGLASLDERRLLLNCGFGGSAGGAMVPRRLYLSADAGATWSRLPDPPQYGNFCGMAILSERVMTIGFSTSAESGVILTTDGSRHWRQTLSFGDDGFPQDFGFTDATHGFVIRAFAPHADDLYVTDDGGRHWVARAIAS
jgi:photosystem II stability/assembly factor-like uncharacterized protein